MTPAISTVEAKEKLGRLRELLPNLPHELFYEFWKYFADQLTAELLPMGFVLAVKLVLEDLQKGVDGVTHEPIKNDLVGLPESIYATIELTISEVAEAIFPADFAAKVKTILK